MIVNCADLTEVMTTGDFAKKTDVDYQTAMGFLKFLRAAGAVKEVGTRPAVSGKGKPSILFSIPEHISINFNTIAIAIAA